MNLRLLPIAVAGSLALASFGVAGASRAQGAPAPPAQDGNAAVAFAKEGRAAFDASRWDEAYDLFAKAQAAASSPVFELYMARSRRNAKKLIDARSIYLGVTRRTIAADAPASWQQAVVDAQAELAVLIGQIPSVVVDASKSPPGTTLRVDARPVRPGETVDVDPGEHVVVATHDGRSSEKRVTLSPGQRGVRVEIGEGAASSASPASPSTPPDDGKGNSSGSIVPGVIGLAVGGVGLGLGGLFGALALGADGDVTTACPENRCDDETELASAKDDQSSSQGLADVSTVMFVVGGVAAATGVVLLVIRPGGGSGAESTGSSDGRGGVALTVRPGGATFSGAF